MLVLERAHERERLVEVLDRARAGRGAAVVIEGAAGIGKTSLLEQVRADAGERGFRRLIGVGDEAEQALPWGIVRQLAERFVARYAGDVRARILAGPAGRALFALDGVPDPDAVGEADFARTLHALWWVAVDLSSERPLLITVDDVQWADVSSQRFLTYLARRIADLPIAIVLATRPPQVASGPLVEITAGRLAERLTPQPLSIDAVGELVARREANPCAEVVAAVRVAAGGNPFLTGQLLDELASRGLALDAGRTARSVPALGPLTVSRALLAGLSRRASTLAGAAAVLGGRGDLRTAAALAGLTADVAGDAADALVSGHVIVVSGGEFGFVHPVVREAVLATLGSGRRSELHAQAARLLHAEGAAAARVAAHLVHAPIASLPDGLGVLRAAAATLLAEGDARTAADHLERALLHAPGDADVRAELGRTLLAAGEFAAARGHLLAAAPSAPSPLEEAGRLADAARATMIDSGPEAAAGELEYLLDGTDRVRDPAARLLLEALLVGCSSYTLADLARSERRLQRFADLPGSTPDERTILAGLAQRRMYAGRPASEVGALVDRALSQGMFDDGGRDRTAWGNALHAAVCADRIDLAMAEVTRARGRLRDGGSPVESAMVGVATGMIALRVGDVLTAEAENGLGLQALALADPAPITLGLSAVGTRFGVMAVLERGDLATAAAMLAAFDTRWPDPPPIVPVQRVRMARAAVALARDDPRTAAAELEVLGEAEDRGGVRIAAMGWRTLASTAALRLGDAPRARDLAEEQLVASRVWGTATDVGVALRLVARVDPERRRDLLMESVATLEDAPARLELAWSLAELGEALRVAGQRADARVPLMRAGELAGACGARVLGAKVADGLAALGDRPRKLMFTGLESLTASERRVAQMAEVGRSNRDIAQELFLSPKTVENHLGRVYVKLGITGRRDLGRALT